MPSRAAAPTLERIRQLTTLLGDPHLAAPVVHLTGTNGKGSTARVLTELFAEHGLKVGTYTSPNLSKVNERLVVGGEPISDDDLANILDSIRRLEAAYGLAPTRFEILTAAAFAWFADVAVDVAVIEVGLGGRWDATNVVEPQVSVVTNISYDHVEVLGPALEDIAREKSGIFKPRCAVVVGERDPGLAALLARAANEAGADQAWFCGAEFDVVTNRVAVGGRELTVRTPGAVYGPTFLALHGAHQGDNAAIALAAAEAFFGAPIDQSVVDQALGRVRVPGRLEVVGRFPLVVVDGAHNVAGAHALSRALADDFSVDGERVAVVGMLVGRDPSAIIEALAAGGVRRVVACTAPSPRALSGAEVADAARALGLHVAQADSVAEAVTLGMGLVADDGLLVVTGSLYMVAEARELLEADVSARDGRV